MMKINQALQMIKRQSVNGMDTPFVLEFLLLKHSY